MKTLRSLIMRKVRGPTRLASLPRNTSQPLYSLACRPRADFKARPQLRLTGVACMKHCWKTRRRQWPSQSIAAGTFMPGLVTTQGPQIPDPRDPIWQPNLEAHLKWWKGIVELPTVLKAVRCYDLSRIRSGTHPTLLPHTQKPIADLWKSILT